ncbi:MAG: phosphatidylglycerol---prolipoprotein diacylglyceryl transferase [Thermoleophilaceae bacterium]|nr:phosphatidylglycerol---prolipoprotein diacylglyceryl transferase [Thermoleophilaceae bacterium]
MQPELHIGPLTLQTFGICFGLAFVACGAILARRLREIGKPRDWAYEIVFSALVGGLVGARLDYIVQNWRTVHNDLLGNIFSGSGLVWLGGLLGGAAGVVLWAWRRGFLGLALLDMCAAPLALGYAIGRIGCQLSGDGDYGVASSLPWAMSYPKGTVPTTTEVHPTPVYETLAMCAVALLLWNLRDRVRPGILFALYLVLAGVERLLVEFIRRNDEAALGLTLPQLISVGMMVAGGVWLARLVRGPQPAAASRA